MAKSTGNKQPARAAEKRASTGKAGTGSGSRTGAGTGSGTGTMLEAGIKALSLARQHSESGAGKMVASLIDPFGFRKLEDVFDLRVVAALERLGMPPVDAIKALTEEVERLRVRVASLEAAAAPLEPGRAGAASPATGARAGSGARRGGATKARRS